MVTARNICMIVLHYFGFKRSKNVFTNYLWELASKLVISGCFHLLQAFMSFPLCGVHEAKDGVLLGSLESHVCSIYFRNLFNAFDTSKQGRISLDYNQFIYCGMISFLSFCHDHTTRSFVGWVWLSWVSVLLPILRILQRLFSVWSFGMLMHNIMTGPSSFDDPFLCQVSILAVPIFQMSNHYDSVIKVGHCANGMIHDHNSCIWLTMCSCQFADLTDLHVLVKYFPNSRLGFLYRYQGSVTVRYCLKMFQANWISSGMDIVTHKSEIVIWWFWDYPLGTRRDMFGLWCYISSWLMMG